MLRYRKSISNLKVVKELDAFPKVPETYTQTTATGGTVSIISFILIIVLVVSEIVSYNSSNVIFKYDVDTDFDSKIQINIDITVAMPCETIGADVLDVTKGNSRTFGKLNEEAVFFELTPNQRAHWDAMQRLNNYIREQYHSLQDVLWTEGYAGILRGIPPREIVDNNVPNACRLHGSLGLNKVAGNFHITAGKHIPHPIGHAHVSLFLRDEDHNFSHRIERFTFGEPLAGIFDPLEGDEKIASSNYHLFQYYIKVVPTEVTMGGKTVSTYQYSVTEQERAINHASGSHGMPGIYFKYDLSSVKVKVLEDKMPLWRFLIRLCGIVGGIYATSDIISRLVSFVVDVISCKYLAEVKRTRGEENSLATGTLLTPPSPNDLVIPPLTPVFPTAGNSTIAYT